MVMPSKMRSTTMVARVAVLVTPLRRLKYVGADELADAGGEDVVCHVAYDHDVEGLLHADLGDYGRRRTAPANSTHAHTYEIKSKSWHQPEVVGTAERGPHLVEMDTQQGDHEKHEANCYTDDKLTRLEQGGSFGRG